MNNYTIIALLIGVVGYFLRDLHTRLKQTEKDVSTGHDKIVEYKSKFEQIENSQKSGFVHLEKLFEEKFKSIDKTLEHMNANLKTSQELFTILINDKNK